MLKNNLFIFLQKCLPQHLLSRLSAFFANNKYPPLKNILIKMAIKKVNISLKYAKKKNIDDYKTFNEFFTRELDEHERPISNEKNAFISPADGVLSQFGKIENGNLIQAKGKLFTLSSLLGENKKMCENFANGSFFTIYLSPSDYHRVHIPFDGKLIHMTFIPGKLFSVNKITTEGIDQVFSRNERVICYFDTEFGVMAVIFVGALLVASVITKWHGIVAPSYHSEIKEWDYSSSNISYIKGQEIGHFQFGSTIICCTPKESIQFTQDTPITSSIKMGETIAQVSK
jgi:phosphatidylserine decarboxylase